MLSSNNPSSSPFSSALAPQTSHSLASGDNYAFLVSDPTSYGPTDNESDRSNDAQETVTDNTANELLRPPSRPPSINNPDKSSIRNRSPSSNLSHFHGTTASITNSTGSLLLRDQNSDMRTVLKRKQQPTSSELTLPPVPSPTQLDQPNATQRGRTPVHNPDRQGKQRRRSSAIKTVVRRFLTLGKDSRHDNTSSDSFEVDDDKKFTVTPLIARTSPTDYESLPSRGKDDLANKGDGSHHLNDSSVSIPPASRNLTDVHDDRPTKPDSFKIREPEPLLPDRGDLYPDKGQAFSSLSRPTTGPGRDLDHRENHHLQSNNNNNTRNINNGTQYSIDNYTQIPQSSASRFDDGIPRAISINASPYLGLERNPSKGSSLSLPDQSTTERGEGMRRAARRRSRSVTTFHDIFRHKTTQLESENNEQPHRQTPMITKSAHPSTSKELLATGSKDNQYDQATLKGSSDDSNKHVDRQLSFTAPWITALDEPEDSLAERVASLEVKLMDLESAMVRFQTQCLAKAQPSGSKLPVPASSTKRSEAESRALPRKHRRPTVSQGHHNTDGRSNDAGRSDDTPIPSPNLVTVSREEYDNLVHLVHHERTMRGDLEGQVQSLRQDVQSMFANITANKNAGEDAAPDNHDSITSTLNSENSCSFTSGTNPQSTATVNGSFNFFEKSANDVSTMEPPPRRQSHRMQHTFATLPLPKNAHRPHQSSLPISHHPQLSVPAMGRPATSDTRSRSPSVPITSTVARGSTSSPGLKLLPPRNTDTESAVTAVITTRNPTSHVVRPSTSSEASRERLQGHRRIPSPRTTGSSELSPSNRLHTYRSNNSLSRMTMSTPTINEHEREKENFNFPMSPRQREMKITVKPSHTRIGGGSRTLN